MTEQGAPTPRHTCLRPNVSYIVRYVVQDGVYRLQVAEDVAVTGVWSRWGEPHTPDECPEHGANR